MFSNFLSYSNSMANAELANLKLGIGLSERLRLSFGNEPERAKFSKYRSSSLYKYWDVTLVSIYSPYPKNSSNSVKKSLQWFAWSWWGSKMLLAEVDKLSFGSCVVMGVVSLNMLLGSMVSSIISLLWNTTSYPIIVELWFFRGLRWSNAN